MKSKVTGLGWRWVSVLGVAVLGGCAQVHSGPYGTPVDPSNQPTGKRTTEAGLRLSAHELTRWSSPQFGMIEVTFENDGTAWAEIRDVHIALPPEQVPGTTILTSRRIASFREAARRRSEIQEHNLAIGLGVLTLGGLVVSKVGDGPAAAVGAVGATAGLTGLMVKEQTASADRASHVEPYPESHLLGGPFSVGPGLFAKKWIVLETNPNLTRACVERLRVSYRLQSGREERVWLSFRDASSPWQRERCRR